MNFTDQERAYFESEAARPFVAAQDHAFAVAVSRIMDDHGRAWRAWLASADEMVRSAVKAAYERRNAQAAVVAEERRSEAQRVYDAAVAARLAKGKDMRQARKFALRKAREIRGDFVAKG